MNLRFFADHCVSTFIIDSLKEAGHEVLRLRDYIPEDSADSIVISKAQELNSILLSLNMDFADILTYPPTDYKGIIALQVRNFPEIIPQIMRRLLNYLSAHNKMVHFKGKLILVEAHRIRIR